MAVAAAAIAVTVASAGTAGAAIGMGLTMTFGGTAATAAAITPIATLGCYGVAAGIGACAASDVTEVFTGCNPIRDGVMGGNQQLYDITETLLYVGSAAITTLAADNPGLKNLNARKDKNIKRPYASLEDPDDVAPGKDFSAAQKQKIISENKRMNGGVVKSDLSKIELIKPQKSQKGITPSPLEWQIDHIVPKSAGGTNSYANAQVLSRQENRQKWNYWS